MFATAGVLLCIVKRGERLPLASIGLRTDHPGKSLAWGLLLAVVALVVTIGLYFALPMIGPHVGGSRTSGYKPSLWVVALIMLRAGVVEEIFYRGSHSPPPMIDKARAASRRHLCWADCSLWLTGSAAT